MKPLLLFIREFSGVTAYVVPQTASLPDFIEAAEAISIKLPNTLASLIYLQDFPTPTIGPSPYGLALVYRFPISATDSHLNAIIFYLLESGFRELFGGKLPFKI